MRKQEQNILPVESYKKENIDEQPVSETEVIEVKHDKQVDTKNLNAESMTKEDYLKVLELLRTPSFIKMVSDYSPKEVMIVSLKLGYIDGKCFSTSAISEFLGIEQQEVIDTTKKVLLVYKKRINQIIDGIIQIVTDEIDVTISLQVK